MEKVYPFKKGLRRRLSGKALAKQLWELQTPRSHERPDGCGSPPGRYLRGGGGELVSRRSCLAD